MLAELVRLKKERKKEKKKESKLPNEKDLAILNSNKF